MRLFGNRMKNAKKIITTSDRGHHTYTPTGNSRNAKIHICKKYGYHYK